MPLTATPVTLRTRRDIEARRGWPVALVAMPFVQAPRPSIQIGLLEALAAQVGFPVTAHSLFLEFAARVGLPQYGELGVSRHPMIGDWLFSAAAFGPDAPDPGGRFLDEFDGELEAILAAVGEDRAWVEHTRSETVPTFLDEVATTIDWGQFRVVGFTSSFQQNTASFALARRIKERWPEVQTVFGGANFDGPMGPAWVRAIPFIDYAVTGEADVAWPELLIALHEGRDPSEIAGVITRDRASGEVRLAHPARPFDGLDSLPTPVYDEYFERAERLGLLSPSRVRTVDIPFESARGCWWGERRQCTFCGLNGTTMAYRSKSATRVLDELAELARRYGSFTMVASDNILDLSYFDDVLDRLAVSGADYRLFYEVKANLSRADIHRLADGGVDRIQPGIESLSSRVLGLMRKGIRASHNVNFLRWTTYYGVEASWNLLWGFPGEAQADYDDQADLFASLHHIRPPRGAGAISIERFSPIFEDRNAFPAAWVRPSPEYAWTYPASVDLDAVAFHFEAALEGTLPATAFAGVQAAVETWQSAWKQEEDRPTMTFRWTPGLLHIEDDRQRVDSHVWAFEGALADLYAAASDSPVTASQLAERLALPHDAHEVGDALQGFVDRRLMMRDGNLFLSLALPATTGR